LKTSKMGERQKGKSGFKKNRGLPGTQEAPNNISPNREKRKGKRNLRKKKPRREKATRVWS